MKKTYLTLLFGALVSMAANAQLYFVGNFQGDWDPQNPREVMAEADGSYKVMINDLSKFKMSTTKGDWDTFNSGAFGYSGEINGPGTFDLVPWGEDQTMPWAGDWTIEINADRTQMTLSTTTEPPTSVEFYLRGTMNGWGSPATWKFQQVEGDLYEIRNVQIAATESFKVADAGWGKINYGGATKMEADKDYTLIYNSTDCSLAADFTGVVQFDLGTKVIKFVSGTIEPPKPIVKELYIVGENYGNWAETAEEYHFTKEDNVYTLTLNGLQGEWKIWNGTWDYTFGAGGDPIVAGNNEVWFNSSVNFTFNTENKVVLTLTVPDGADTIDSGVPASLDIFEEIDGIESIGVENGEAEYFNLQGVRVAHPERGIFIERRGGKVSKVVL